MRIVIDLQGAQCENRFRGIGRYSLSLAQSIVRNKGEHDVIIALNGLFPETIEPIRSAFDTLLPQENIQVWHVPSAVRHLDSENIWRRKSAELVREEFLISLNPDVIYITSLFEGLVDNAVTSIGLLQKIPTAVTLYDLIPLINRKPYLDNPAVESWYENKLDQIRRADLLLAISESSRQEGIEHLGFPLERTVNIGTAADPQFRQNAVSSDEEADLRERYGLKRQFLMYTGGIDPRKNVEGLIRGYALLPVTLREETQLAIVCSVQPDGRRKLEELAKEQGLDIDDVILTGFVPEDDLITLYHLCKAFIFPSWHEGFGLPALEAMCCGAPVIAANTSSLPEVVGKNDALFDPRDDKEIANKIEEVLTNSTFRTELISHGLKQSKKFSWDESAQRAINAFEAMHAENQKINKSYLSNDSRPKLAYVSPLPPGRSGIADYSAELLPELSLYYDIDVVVAQDVVTDPWIKENCSIRSVEWFSEHTHIYDRVLYHFGNSDYHLHMFDMLEKNPGIVVLHDFFLSGIVAHIDVYNFNPNAWARELYHAYGYKAVQERFHTADTADVVWKYPCNQTVLENSRGIIVHSDNSKRLADQWMGEKFSKHWSVIPHLRVPNIKDSRKDARLKLDISEDSFVICSFGLLGPTKQNHRLLKSWLASPLAKDQRCMLIFVGENHNGNYGTELKDTILESGVKERIRITGWTDTAEFRQYLAAADVGVQLRTLSRGETSGTVLDCMNYGLPTIVNANGSMADISEDAVWMLPDEFDDSELTQAINTLWRNQQMRDALGMRARETILTKHAPRSCALQYFQAIEHHYKETKNLKEGLIGSIAKLEGHPADEAWIALAKSISQNHPPLVKKQLLIDISELVQRDARSGIQRVVRSILLELLANPPDGYKIEPVYATANEEGYRYARQYTLRFLKCPDQALVDETVEVFNGDIFFGLDFQPHIIPQQSRFYDQIRNIGAKVYFLVHDLLPVLEPWMFSEGAAAIHTRWLNTLEKTDGVICVSRTVADEMIEWIDVFGTKRLRPFHIGWSHNGADLSGSIPTMGLPDDANHVLQAMAKRPTFLMVGTLEPRKGQGQTLAAFEMLWAQGHDVNLVIVGKQGWMVEKMVDSLRDHTERNQRLFWLDGISDEYLEKIYSTSTCLIAASEGEGFGLPLIEAAQHKIPIIARDIPVFREVAGEHAFYFSGVTPDALAECVIAWLSKYQMGQAPKSDSMPWLTWKESTNNLLNILNDANWYKHWLPDGAVRLWASDSQFSTKMGTRSGRDMISAGKAGYLLYGPYIPMKSGDYRVAITGKFGRSGPTGSRIDVAINKGDLILAECSLNEPNEDGSLAELFIRLDAPCTDLEVRVWVSEETELKISIVEIMSLNENKDKYHSGGNLSANSSIKKKLPPKKIRIYDNGKTVGELTSSNGDKLAITFQPYGGLGYDVKGFGENYLISLGYDVLCFKTISNNWYQDVSKNDLSKHVGLLAKNYSFCIGYGSSMGAYAALYFSEVLNLNTVIAFSPQFSIDRKLVSFENRWENEANSLQFNHQELLGNKEVKVITIYDPFDKLDKKHASLIRKKFPTGKDIRLPFTGHPPLISLNESEQLRTFVEALLENKSIDFFKCRKLIREKSGEYSKNILQYCIEKKPNLTAKVFNILAQTRSSDQNWISSSGRVIAKILFSHGLLKEAESIASTVKFLCDKDISTEIIEQQNSSTYETIEHSFFIESLKKKDTILLEKSDDFRMSKNTIENILEQDKLINNEKAPEVMQIEKTTTTESPQNLRAQNISFKHSNGKSKRKKNR